MTSQARPANAHTSSWPSGSRYRWFVQHSGALQRTESSGLHFPVGLPPESLALRRSSYTSLNSSDLQIFRSSDPRPPASSRKLRLRSDICVQPNSSDPTNHSASDIQIEDPRLPGGSSGSDPRSASSPIPRSPRPTTLRTFRSSDRGRPASWRKLRLKSEIYGPGTVGP